MAKRNSKRLERDLRKGPQSGKPQQKPPEKLEISAEVLNTLALSAIAFAGKRGITEEGIRQTITEIESRYSEYFGPAPPADLFRLVLQGRLLVGLNQSREVAFRAPMAWEEEWLDTM